MAEEKKLPSRSEREATIKDKAGWVITVLAALLAINTLVGGGNSSKILNNTIAAYDLASQQTSNKELSKKWKEKADSYESDPKTGEGKKELMEKARKLEAERTDAKARSPWFTYSGSLLQIAIVLLTASILAVNMVLFWASIGVGSTAILLMTQALWLWVPFMR